MARPANQMAAPERQVRRVRDIDVHLDLILGPLAPVVFDAALQNLGVCHCLT